MIEIGSHPARFSMVSSVKHTVYVVDDDDAVLGSLRFLLESDGFAVRTFRNATALLNATSLSGADCYVIDYKMPDINGIELAGRLRQTAISRPGRRRLA
jgi:two-component system, LuxR family, response regulator FixJ